MANTASHQRDKGLRGRDKHQDALQDRNGGQGIVRDQRGGISPRTASGRNARRPSNLRGTPHNRSRNRRARRPGASSGPEFAVPRRPVPRRSKAKASVYSVP
jgi:hypothetical protein